MSSIINLTGKYIVQNGYNNVLRYEFPNSSVNFKDTEIAISNIQMYNSQFNIHANQYNNNKFTIEMPTGATTTLINITLNDGYYSYTDINKYIMLQLIASGAYLIDNNNNNVFYIQLSANQTYYAAQIDLSPVPTALPVGWTRPTTGFYSAGGSGLPSTSYVPRIIVPQSFNNIIGFSTGTFPASAQTTSQTFISTITPQINPVSNYIVRCNLINNPFSTPPDVITSFTSQGTSIGQVIDVQPNEYAWLAVADGVRPYIEVIIVDQNERFVKFQDPSINIQILVRQKETKK